MWYIKIVNRCIVLFLKALSGVLALEKGVGVKDWAGYI